MIHLSRVSARIGTLSPAMVLWPLVLGASHPEVMTPGKLQEPEPVIRTSTMAVRTDHTLVARSQ